MKTKPKIAITGINGFVGSHFAEFALESGYEVHGVIRSTSSTAWVDHLDIHYHRIGLEDPLTLAKVFEGCDYVFHIAGVTNAKDYEGYYQGNVALTQGVYDGVKQCKKPPKKIIVTSSIAAGAPSSLEAPHKESDSSSPVSTYGRSKLEMESMTQVYVEENVDLCPIALLRAPIVYGPRDTEMYAFFKSIGQGLFPKVGRQEKHVSLIYVKDLCKALILLAEHEDAKGIYYAHSDDAISWTEIAKATGQTLNKKYLTLTIPHIVLYLVGRISGFMNQFRSRRSVLDIEKAREGVQSAWVCDDDKIRALGYSHDYPFQQGIVPTIAYYQENGKL